MKSETQTTTTVTTTTPGTIRWMAPELFKRGAKCTTASDIYALVWIFWELSSRKIPFQDEHHATDALIQSWIKDGEREAIPISTPPRFAHLLTQCWAQRAEERPSTEKAVAEGIPSADAEPNVSSGYAYYSQP